jgi:hypothetical protein
MLKKSSVEALSTYISQKIDAATTEAQGCSLKSFALRRFAPPLDEVIEAVLIDTIHILSALLRRLTIHAHRSLRSLRQAEEWVAALHGLVYSEGPNDLRLLKRDTLLDLWMKVGGKASNNGKELKHFVDRLIAEIELLLLPCQKLHAMRGGMESLLAIPASERPPELTELIEGLKELERDLHATSFPRFLMCPICPLCEVTDPTTTYELISHVEL